MTIPWTAGQRVLASDLNLATGQQAWTTSFVPIWALPGGSPALGNGTVNTGYLKLGRLCSGRYQYTFGSTTTFGTGTNAYNFTLPLSANTPASNFWNIGSWSGLSGPDFYSGSAYLTTSGVMQLFYSGVSTSVGPVVPNTWASGGYLQIDFSYETTS